MGSLRTRLLLSASLVLLVFLGGAGLLLDRAFQDSAMNGVEDRLRGHVFMLIGAADFDARPAPAVGALPDPALATPASGHYARIVDGAGEVVWDSDSLLGLSLGAPAATEAGEWRLAPAVTSDGTGLFSLAYGIIWEGAGDRAPRAFVIEALEDETLYRDTLRRFRRSLWLWFAGLSVALLVVQALNLGWGLRPLARVGEEVRAIEQGRSEELAGAYPAELSALTGNLNKLLRHNRDNLRRYRNSLGDLAHSIKTPLAVLRNEVERAEGGAAASAAEQIERIDRTVQYYLKRSGGARAVMLPPVAVAPLARRIVATLEKVYAERDLEIRCRVDDGLLFAADEGDLFEIIGNLADNACKWAGTRVELELSRAGQERLRIVVRDDGPGIPDDQIERITQRGARLDESVEGQGIGLAIVRDLVENAYGGSFSLASDAAGTRAIALLNAG
ncbi:MAG: ATP-binding protein [Gammaproteobacteria bacterium]